MLKDLNLLELNEEMKSKSVDIDDLDRRKLTSILKKDSEFLHSFSLIDYSLFIIQFNNKNGDSSADFNPFESKAVIMLHYDMNTRTYRLEKKVALQKKKGNMSLTMAVSQA